MRIRNRPASNILSIIPIIWLSRGYPRIFAFYFPIYCPSAYAYSRVTLPTWQNHTARAKITVWRVTLTTTTSSLDHSLNPECCQKRDGQHSSSGSPARPRSSLRVPIKCLATTTLQLPFHCELIRSNHPFIFHQVPLSRGSPSFLETMGVGRSNRNPAPDHLPHRILHSAKCLQDH